MQSARAGKKGKSYMMFHGWYQLPGMREHEEMTFDSSGKWDLGLIRECTDVNEVSIKLTDMNF